MTQERPNRRGTHDPSLAERLALGQLFVALALAGCSNGGTPPAAPEDASLADVAAPEDSAPAPMPVDAGPLWQRCNPASAASCPSGFECFPSHTSPIDAYGTCVFTCAGSSEPACALAGGTCACPLTATDAAGDCSEGNEAGTITVCVPAGDAGPSGDNQLEDAAAPPDDSGSTDAG
jgi:hypothetical protein